MAVQNIKGIRRTRAETDTACVVEVPNSQTTCENVATLWRVHRFMSKQDDLFSTGNGGRIGIVHQGNTALGSTTTRLG
jgi:hypothetical protein